MSVLITTPKAVDANAYASVARADVILGQRLHTEAWDEASSTPSADGYLANGAESAGATTVDIDTGTGSFTSGTKFQFAEHDTVYTVSGVSGATLTFSPALTDNVADDEEIIRITPSTKEAALIWSTTLFDNLMSWYGTKRTKEQRLRWPRSGVVGPDGYFYDYDTYPEILEIATAEMALILVDEDKFKDPDSLGLGVSKVVLGPMSAEIDSLQQQNIIPDSILALLDPLGYLEDEAQFGTKIVPLKRA